MQNSVPSYRLHWANSVISWHPPLCVFAPHELGTQNTIISRPLSADLSGEETMSTVLIASASSERSIQVDSCYGWLQALRGGPTYKKPLISSDHAQRSLSWAAMRSFLVSDANWESIEAWPAERCKRLCTSPKASLTNLWQAMMRWAVPIISMVAWGIFSLQTHGNRLK